MSTLPAIMWSEQSVRSSNGFPIHLTSRQREILLLLCEGLPNKLIARRLDLSHATVKSHVASILRSLNVATRLEAVALAHRIGIIHYWEAERAAGRRACGDVADHLDQTHAQMLSASVA
jgi:DNA-binding NarL/FixJ family response regulator